MPANKKECRFLEFTAEMFWSPVETHAVKTHCDCEPDCATIQTPRNLRTRVTDGPKQITLPSEVYRVHVFSPEGYDVQCLDWNATRNTDCGGCCSPEMYQVPVAWKGSGMAIASGEYVFDLSEQMMPIIDFSLEPGDTREYTIELMFEPISDEEMKAVQYNANALGC
jgi:hypothetical protein